jgi:Protein of unknown function (DUF1553)/Protein of unknown function (DUF1549)
MNAALAFLALTIAADPTPRVVTVTVEPAELTLSHPRFGHRLLVTGIDNAGRAVDLTTEAVWSARDKTVADVRNGRIVPRGNGQTVVSAEVAGKRLEVPVRVNGFQADPPVSLRLEVEPVLTKASCNAGACHGAQYGKGGFKLSLFGDDPNADHNAILRDGLGRRVNVIEPTASLLLMKPNTQVSHQGGKRLPSGTREYEALRRWIADACPSEDEQKTPRVVSLEVLPRERIFTRPDSRQTLLAIATLSDGSKRDVTPDARFDSNTPTNVTVDRDGLAATLHRGEGVVMARYLGHAAVARLLVVPDDPAFTWPDSPAYNFIDELVDAKLKKMRYVPSPLCTDEEFIRRACLDAAGTLPKPDEVEAFLADSTPSREKRRKYIDDLFDRPEYAAYWTLEWDDLLHNHGRFGTIKPMFTLRNWVQASLRNNKPMDQFAAELITSRGNTFREGPANFYRLHKGSENVAEAVAGIFLGVRLECAKCHHHPFEKWTQDDYYGLAAYFARVGEKDAHEYGPVRGIYGSDDEIFVTRGGELFHPRTRKLMAPTPLGAGQPSDDPLDRRRALARWLTDPSNPLFARNLVNRHWAHFLGRGLVEPVDDLRDTNPPTNPELLDALARDLISHHYDLRHLLRTIMNSATYQRSSRAIAGSTTDTIYYSHYYARRLRAEPLMDAVCSVTGAPEKFSAPGDSRPFNHVPAGTRAIALPAIMSDDLRNYFLDVFDRPQRTFEKCECVRSEQPNLAQVLHLMNGQWLHDKVSDPNGRLSALLKGGKSDQEIIATFYRAAFSRQPTAAEQQTAARLILLAPTRKEGLEDLLWTLCNCKEFLFNH